MIHYTLRIKGKCFIYIKILYLYCNYYHLLLQTFPIFYFYIGLQNHNLHSKAFIGKITFMYVGVSVPSVQKFIKTMDFTENMVLLGEKSFWCIEKIKIIKINQV